MFVECSLCRFREKIKIVHFIGPIKPWHHPFNTATKTVTTMPETGHSQEFLQIWWDLFMELVQPKLDPTLVGSRTTLSWPEMGIGCRTLLRLVDYPEKEVKTQSCQFCELFSSLKYMNKATVNTLRKRHKAQCCPFCELFFFLKYMNKATVNTQRKRYKAQGCQFCELFFKFMNKAAINIMRKRSKHKVVSSVSCFSPWSIWSCFSNPKQPLIPWEGYVVHSPSFFFSVKYIWSSFQYKATICLQLQKDVYHILVKMQYGHPHPHTPSPLLYLLLSHLENVWGLLLDLDRIWQLCLSFEGLIWMPISVQLEMLVPSVCWWMCVLTMHVGCLEITVEFEVFRNNSGMWDV